MAAVPLLSGDARLPGELAAADAALGSRAPFEPLFASAAALALASFAAATGTAAFGVTGEVDTALS